MARAASNGMANAVPDVANSMANSDPGMANSTTYRYRDAEKRRGYQREYMRRRRAGS